MVLVKNGDTETPPNQVIKSSYQTKAPTEQSNPFPLAKNIPTIETTRTLGTELFNQEGALIRVNNATQTTAASMSDCNSAVGIINEAFGEGAAGQTQYAEQLDAVAQALASERRALESNLITQQQYETNVNAIVEGLKKSTTTTGQNQKQTQSLAGAYKELTSELVANHKDTELL